MENQTSQTTIPQIPPAPPPTPTPPNNQKMHTGKKWIVLSLVVLLLSLFALAGSFILFAPKKPPEANPTPQANTQAPLKIGTDATYQPMEFLDENGVLIGYDIDLATRLGEKMNRKVDIINTPWDDLFVALENGSIDMIISGVTITDERKEKYTFSDPYINAGQVIITRPETGISSLGDLQGKRIAVQKGTTNEEEARKYTAQELVLSYDDFIGATQALINGEADAIFSDLTNAKGIINKNPTLTIAGDPITSEYYGIVFRKGEGQLVQSVNSALDELRLQGVLVYLKQKWLE